MEEHQARVDGISARVHSFHDRKERYRIYDGTTSTTRRTSLRRDNVVDTSGMDYVLGVDVDRGVAVVEPNVSMERLVNATLEYGIVPLVVMEFPAITVGGGFAGSSGESSSFRHGLFENTIRKIEIVLADGEVVFASETERPDLLSGAAGSFGTFGVTTLLEVKLRPARKHIELTYRSVSSTDEAVQTFEQLTEDSKVEYLEGIMFAMDRGVIIHGKMTDGADSKYRSARVARFTRAVDPWFYMHAEERLRDAGIEDAQDLVPVKDYVFRYDRGIFWGGKYSFQYFLTPCWWITRWALDSFLRSKVAYHALDKSRLADQYVVQDICFPYAAAAAFVEYIDQTFGFYPLWLCPLKMEREAPLRPRRMAAFSDDARSPGMMINIGLWGPGPVQYDQFVRANRDIERETADLGGFKCFYAQAYYTEEEFWRLYDKHWYDDLRIKYKASGLLSINEKVNVDLSSWTSLSDMTWRPWLYQKFKEQWPVKGIYGVLQVFLDREYLLK